MEVLATMNAGPAAAPGLDLGGQWAAALADDELRRNFPRPDFDDQSWAQVTVPGHWQASAQFATSDGPVVYRRRFEAPAPVPGERAWLVMDGAFYQTDVWLDGSYLGDTEGYFFPHTFEVTAALAARSEHLLAIEVGCDRPSRAAKKSLLGAWSDGNCIAPGYNPGGLWAPVRIVTTGPVKIASLWLACTEAGPQRATLQFSALLASSQATTAQLCTEVRHAGLDAVAARAQTAHPLAVGQNRARWRLEVPAPRLWWPVGLGDQPLYDVIVRAVDGGDQSDVLVRRTGLRQIRAHKLRFSINGEELFLKGANLMPTRLALADAAPAEVAGDVETAKQCGLNLLRAHAHVARPELYEAADRLGIMVWQDMPLHGRYRGARRQAARQARKAVGLLGHHPSVCVWCAHSEPFPTGATGPGWRPGRSLRRLVAQGLPTPARSLLDQSTRRSFERADPSRPALAGSGVLPHLARATATHLYFGWYHGEARGLATMAKIWPAAVRFVSELGAQAVPHGGLPLPAGPWPEVRWDDWPRDLLVQQGVFDRRVPPSEFATFEAWRDATQAYQAELVRCQVETLRRLRSRPTGGFAVHFLNDSQPAISSSLVDHERVPKLALHALGVACSQVLAIADWPAPRYEPGEHVAFRLHVVNDLAQALLGAVVEARISWPGGGRAWTFGGDVAAASCTFVGKVSCVLPDPAGLAGVGEPELRAGLLGRSWSLRLEVELRWGAPPQSVLNSYDSAIARNSGKSE